MPPDLYFALTLIVKMAVTAAFLLAATVTAERAGPLIGGLVATLPISAGPVYIFLALDHDAHFIAQSALGSLVTNAFNVVFALTYALLAQKRGLIGQPRRRLRRWTALIWASGFVTWTLAAAILLNVVVVAGAFWLSAPLRHAPMPRVRRRWYDLVLRAAMVALLVGMVVTLSFRIGPTRERQSGGVPDRAHQHHDHPASPRRRAGDRGGDGQCGDRARRLRHRRDRARSHRRPPRLAAGARR